MERKRRRRRRREWNKHVTRMDAVILVKISRENIPDLQDVRKEDGDQVYFPLRF